MELTYFPKMLQELHFPIPVFTPKGEAGEIMFIDSRAEPHDYTYLVITDSGIIEYYKAHELKVLTKPEIYDLNLN